MSTIVVAENAFGRPFHHEVETRTRVGPVSDHVAEAIECRDPALLGISQHSRQGF